MSDRDRAVGLEPCPKCGSKDNLKRYADGHAWCFTAGCGYRERGDGEAHAVEQKILPGLLAGQVPRGGLSKRKISEKTCQRYGYLTGEDDFGEPVQLAQYRNAAGAICAQKLRYADKRGFPWRGSPQQSVLFGQHLQGSGKRLFVTEGEIDAMSLAEMLDNRWPVNSIINGAPNAKKDLLKSLEYLKSFEELVIVFDMDEAGRTAAEECALALAPVLPVYVATYSLKDPNEMLVAGRVEEMVNVVFRAAKWRPRMIVTLAEIWDDLLEEPELGKPWPWPVLTQATYGRRRGELYAFSSGVGCGKTDMCHAWEAFDLFELGVPVAAFHLEEPSKETGLRIIGKHIGKPLYLPEVMTKEERRRILNEVEEEHKIKNRTFLYGKGGFTDWDTVRDTLRYLHHAEGVQHYYLDHLTALTCRADDERRFLDRVMEEMAGITKELGLIGHFISHLRTPEGKPHEEGGRVKENQLIGSRAIMQWAHFIFGLERNKQNPNENKRVISTFRILKDRFTGCSTGRTFYLRYDPETTLLSETSEAPFDPAEEEDVDF